MSVGIPQSRVERLAALSEEEQRDFIAKMSPEDILKLDADFEAWHAKGQMPPQGEGWRTWLMMAGRGFGKTRAGAEWISRVAMSGKRRIALVSASIDEARSVMVEGKSGLIAVSAARGVRIKWEPSLGKLTWPSGSVAMLYSGDHPDGLRGPEFDFAWADELAKWREAEAAWDNLQMGLRAGTRPRVLVTTTPRAGSLLKRIMAEEATVSTHGRTADNLSLPRRFIDVMMATYGGTRLGRQELDGEFIDEVEGSLFPRELLETARTDARWRDFDRVVVGVDPSLSETGDACGIVVAGRRDGIIHVIADCSVDGRNPGGWSRAAVAAANAWGASHIVAEANQGGEMVREVLKAADAAVRVQLVYASRGKCARAEPIAVRLENGRAVLAGVFPELEAELNGMTVTGRYDGPGRSPDRADAMVWAVTELSETRSGVPRVRML